MSVVRIIEKSYAWHVAPAQDRRLLHQRGVLVGTDELVILITIVDFLFRQEDEWSTCCASDDPACYGPRSSAPGHVDLKNKLCKFMLPGRGVRVAHHGV